MAAFYSRNGDQGYTGLLGKGRIAKEDLRMEALGTVDEVTSALGLARALSKVPATPPLIVEVQRRLYLLMSDVASTPEAAEKVTRITSDDVAWLEQQVDRLTAETTFPREFIVPGDSLPAAMLDMARTVVRRAERRVSELLHRGDLVNAEVLRFMNRLSSLCYLLELREIQESGQQGPTLARQE